MICTFSLIGSTGKLKRTGEAVKKQMSRRRNDNLEWSHWTIDSWILRPPPFLHLSKFMKITIFNQVKISSVCKKSKSTKRHWGKWSFRDLDKSYLLMTMLCMLCVRQLVPIAMRAIYEKQVSLSQQKVSVWFLPSQIFHPGFVCMTRM